ncbi:MAG: hypothetical protein WD098_00445 [Balneolales bacterium]
MAADPPSLARRYSQRVAWTYWRGYHLPMPYWGGGYSPTGLI